MVSFACIMTNYVHNLLQVVKEDTFSTGVINCQILINSWARIIEIRLWFRSMEIAVWIMITFFLQIFRYRRNIFYATRLNTDIGASCFFSSSPKRRVYFYHQARRATNGNSGVMTNGCCLRNTWNYKNILVHKVINKLKNILEGKYQIFEIFWQL